METPATEDTINNILDIVQRNGARNIRIWARDVQLIQKTVPDCIAKTILLNLKRDDDFLWEFVHEMLPGSVRDDEPSRAIRRNVVTASLLSRIRPATAEGIKNIADRAKMYLTSRGNWIPLKSGLTSKETRGILKDVELRSSTYTVQEASRIIHGYVGQRSELSSARQRELLDNFEPFIYGLSPLHQSLEVAAKLFKGKSCKNKILFVVSDGEATDGRNDKSRINQITSELRALNVKVVSCFVTGSTVIQPKRLYDEMQPGWEPGAEFMFLLSSEVPTQHLTRAILAKRDWTVDAINYKTKLFIQANHPDNLR